MTHTAPTIMVTGAGAIIGQGIIRSLRLASIDCRIVGLDRAANSYCASLCDAYYQKAFREDSPHYLPWLRSVIEKEGIRLVLPGIEEDVFYLHDRRSEWGEWPVHMMLSSGPALEAGRDKWHLHERLLHHALPTIPTTSVGEWSDFEHQLGTPPYIVKAKRGSGSRGQMILHSEDDWQRSRHRYGEAHLVQKVVGQDDEEYTVAMFGFGDGTATAGFVMKRKLWNGGTWTADVVEGDAALETYCAALNRVLTPLGPTNYQFRREGNTWWLLEINPRLSASTSIRAGFGFNEAAMCVQYFLHHQRPQPGARRKGRCQRYIADHFEYL